MSTEITFSKAIRLSDIKKSEKLTVGRKEHLYDDDESDVPTFKISHKDFPKECVYVKYYELVNPDGSTSQEMPTYKTKCDDLKFLEVECTISTEHYHILYELNKEFGIEFAKNVDPRDVPEFYPPMSPEEYEELQKKLSFLRKPFRKRRSTKKTALSKSIESPDEKLNPPCDDFHLFD